MKVNKIKLSDILYLYVWYSTDNGYGKKLATLNLPLINGFINIRVIVLNNIEVFGGHLTL